MDNNFKHTKHESHNWCYFLGIIFFAFYAIALFIFLIADLFNLSSVINIDLHYDWPMIICTFISGLSTTFLGIVSIKQNLQLASLNEKSLETSKINNSYSLVHFRENQSINLENSILKLKLYDIRDIPLKYVIIDNITLTPLSEKYKELGSSKIILSDVGQKAYLEFTPKNPENPVNFYFANIKINPKYFLDYTITFIRLEIDFAIVNTLGISTEYSYFILMQFNKKDGNTLLFNNYYEYSYIKNIHAEF